METAVPQLPYNDFQVAEAHHERVFMDRAPKTSLNWKTTIGYTMVIIVFKVAVTQKSKLKDIEHIVK